MVEAEAGQTKWNFDDDRFKALSYYMSCFEESLINFTSYKGITPIEDLHNWTTLILVVLMGAVKPKEEEELEKEFGELEKEKRKCNNLLFSNKAEKQKQQDFVNQSIAFYNKAIKCYRTINKINVKNGFYFRRTPDPRYAALRR